MDENKDKITEELTENDALAEDTQDTKQAAEEAAAEVTEDAAQAEEAAAEVTEDAAQAEEAAADTAESTKEAADEAGTAGETAAAEKKPVLQKTIIISLIIVVIAAICAVSIALFFNNDVTGSWHLVREVDVSSKAATSDEAKDKLNVDYYFNFNSDGTVESTIGTVTSKGTYSAYKNDEGKSVININLYDPLSQYFLSGEYTVDYSGNIFTGKKMKFTMAENEKINYEFESASYKAPEITRDGEFEKKDDYVGKWIYSTGELTLTYELKDDGTAVYTQQAMTLNQYTYTPININVEMRGIYDIKDGTLTLNYYFIEQSSGDFRVRADGDVLYINDFPFTREGAATPDQAQQAQTVAAQQ